MLSFELNVVEMFVLLSLKLLQTIIDFGKALERSLLLFQVFRFIGKSSELSRNNVVERFMTIIFDENDQSTSLEFIRKVIILNL